MNFFVITITRARLRIGHCNCCVIWRYFVINIKYLNVLHNHGGAAIMYQTVYPTDTFLTVNHVVNQFNYSVIYTFQPFNCQTREYSNLKPPPTSNMVRLNTVRVQKSKRRRRALRRQDTNVIYFHQNPGTERVYFKQQEL